MRALLFGLIVFSGCQCGGRLVGVDGLTVTPDFVDFGAVPAAGVSAKEVTLVNEGRRALELTVAVVGDARGTMAASPAKVSLGAGESRVVLLEYVGAQVSGVDEAELELSEGERAAVVRLRGETIVEVLEGPGPTRPDAGAPVSDAGAPVVDAGTAPVDAGTPVVDAGTPVVDAGTPVVDAGSPVVDAGVCVPRSCATAARACGSLDDGCGGTLNCGTCSAGLACSAAGLCVCQPTASTETSCGDGRDDDCDGLIDCVDAECGAATACAPTTCSNQGDLRVSSTTFDSNAPDLAFDGTNFGVAWLEFNPSTTAIDFAFARVSPAQALVGSQVALTTDGRGAHPPRLAWGQGEWAIAATTSLPNPPANGPTNTNRVRRFDATGQTLGTLDMGPGWAATIAAGAGAGQYGTLWGNLVDPQQTRSAPVLTRVANGARAAQDVQLMTPGVGDGIDYGDLLWDGSGWAMTWTATTLTPTSSASVRFARVDAAGTMVVSPRVVASGNAFSPRVAFDGTNYGLTWQQLGTHGRFEVAFTVLDPQGAVVVPTRVVSQSPGAAFLADVSYTGASWVVVWTEDVAPQPTRVMLARLDATGAPRGAVEQVSCGMSAAWRPAVLAAAGKIAVAWGDTRHPGQNEVYVRVLNP